MTSRHRCAACKYLRRKCPQDCIFYPYFPSNDPQRFSGVHKIYGAKNVAKTLQDLPEDQRGEAVESMHIEAQHRIEDPVYGCVRIISQLHQEIQVVETQLAKTRAEIAISNNTGHRDVIPDNNQFHEPHDQSDLDRLVLQGQQIGKNYHVEQSEYSRNSNQAPWNI